MCSRGLSYIFCLPTSVLRAYSYLPKPFAEAGLASHYIPCSLMLHSTSVLYSGFRRALQLCFPHTPAPCGGLGLFLLTLSLVCFGSFTTTAEKEMSHAFNADRCWCKWLGDLMPTAHYKVEYQNDGELHGRVYRSVNTTSRNARSQTKQQTSNTKTHPCNINL